MIKVINLCSIIDSGGGGKKPIKIQPLKDITITTNGKNIIVPDEGYDALKQIQITTNVDKSAYPDAYYIGMSYVKLANYQGNTLPNDIQGWQMVEDGRGKLYKSNIEKFEMEMPFLQQAFNMFRESSIKAVNITNSNLNGNCQNMFYDCIFLHSVNLDINQATSCYSMFYNCNDLQEFICPTINYSKCNVSQMFNYCYSLKKIEVHFDNAAISTSSKISYIFSNCSSLEEVNITFGGIADGTNLLNGSTTLGNRNCLKKVKADLRDITKATGVFRYNNNLTDAIINVNSATAGASIFQDCPNLTNLDFFDGSEIQIGGFRPAYNPKLTYQSFQNIINHLKDMGAVGDYKNMYITSAQNDMLTDDDRARIVNKEWRINIV